MLARYGLLDDDVDPLAETVPGRSSGAVTAVPQRAVVAKQPVRAVLAARPRRSRLSCLCDLQGALGEILPYLCAASEARLISVCSTIYTAGAPPLVPAGLPMDPSCHELLASLGPTREALQRTLLGISAAAVANAGVPVASRDGAGAANDQSSRPGYRGSGIQVHARSDVHRTAAAKQLWRCRTLLSFALREAEKCQGELRRLHSEQQRSRALDDLLPQARAATLVAGGATPSASEGRGGGAARRIARAPSSDLFGGVPLPVRSAPKTPAASKKAQTFEERLSTWLAKVSTSEEYRDVQRRIQQFQRAVHLSRLPANRPKHQPLENLISERLNAFLCETRETISNMEHYYERGGGGDDLAMNDRLMFESQMLDDFSSPALHTVSELSEVANQRYALMLRTLHDAQLGLSAGHLGETAGKLNAMVVDLACAELRPILSHTTPHAMLNCVVRCCRIISGALNLQMKTNKSNAHVGADDFLPTFIWVVLRAKVPELVTSIRFIEMYHDPELLLTAEAGYCFANLTSAVMFLENFSRKSAIDMGLEPKHFDAALERAEADAAARAAEQRAGPRRRTTLHNVFQQKLERALAFKNIPARPPPAPQGKGRPRGHARRATAVPATLQASSRQAASAAAAAQPRSRRASSGGTVGFDSPVNRARAEERRAQCLAAAAASAAGSSFGPGELMASHGGAFPVVLAVRGQDGCLAELRLTALCAPHALILVDRKSACAEPLYIWAYDTIVKWVTKPSRFTLMLSARQVDGFGSAGDSVEVVLQTEVASSISTAMMKQIGNMLKT